MKTKKSKFIIDCLDEKINAEVLTDIKQTDWPSVIELAKKKGLSTIIFYNLKKSNLLSSLPAFAKNDLENSYYCALQQNTIVLRELVSVLKTFNKLAIKTIILKGAALINTVYDGNGALRPMVDIDILIAPEQLELAQNCLKELGYRINAADFGSLTYRLNEIKNLSFSANLELHWHILHKKFQRVFNLNEEMFWKRAITFKIEDVECLGLSCEDNILYLSLHLTILHFFSNILWLYDIKRIIEVYKDNISWDKLLETTQESGTRNTVYYCLTFCRDILGVSLDNSILEKFSPHFMKKKTIACFLKEERILGDFDMNRLSYIIQFLMFDKIKDIIKLILTNVFPEKELLEYRYPRKSYFKAYITYVLRPFKIFSPKVPVGKQKAFN